MIFNLMADHRTEIDTLAHEYFDELYEVKDITASEHAYQLPKGTIGFGARAPVYVEGRCVSGRALALYVITVEGSVVSPHIAKSTNSLLPKLAIQSLSERRYRPALLDGKTVPTVAASWIVFECPSQTSRP